MGGRTYDRTLGVARLVATFALVASLVALSRPNPWWVTGGFVVAAAGEAVRVWAAGHLVKTRELITSGPYRYTRNPLYLGRFLIPTGLCVAASLPRGINWIVLALGWLVFFGYYMRRKERVESTRLHEVHGEAFDRYFREVPALFPRSTAWKDGNTMIGWSSERFLRNREPWMIAFVLLVFLSLLWKSYRT